MSKLEIKDFEFYLVFMDSNNGYVLSYGYEHRPAIIDIKFAFDQLSKEPDLKAAIPDFEKIIDYITVDIMNHKKFIKYMEKAEKLAAKAEEKERKKKEKRKKKERKKKEKRKKKERKKNDGEAN